MEYETYEQSVEAYMANFIALREAPAARDMVTRRGTGDVPVETIITRAEAIADTSANMVTLAQPYLTSQDPALREGISGQLIAQATAEMQLAIELLQVADGKEDRPRAITRAARGNHLHDAISDLDTTMARPVADGLVQEQRVRAAPVLTPSLDEAKQALSQAVSTTTGAITMHVQELGGDIAWNLIMQTSWVSVVEGASLLNKDVAKTLDQLKQGAGALFKRAVTVVARTLINVYDKILALLGKDIEDQARKRAQDWLEQMKEPEKLEGVFGQLVGRLYRVDALKEEVDGVLSGTTADVDQIGSTSRDVSALADKFIALTKRMSMLASALVLAKSIKVPQVLLVIAGLQMSLLAVVVVAGHDYLGYKEPRFPNLTKGVAEVFFENLA